MSNQPYKAHSLSLSPAGTRCPELNAESGLEGEGNESHLRCRFFEQVLRLLEGRTELLTAQNAANILLATAQLRCNTVSKTVLQEVIDRVAAEGNAQEVNPFLALVMLSFLLFGSRAPQEPVCCQQMRSSTNSKKQCLGMDFSRSSPGQRV